MSGASRELRSRWLTGFLWVEIWDRGAPRFLPGDPEERPNPAATLPETESQYKALGAMPGAFAVHFRV